MPYRSGETIKEALSAVIKELCPNDRSVIRLVEDVPLSRKTITNRIDDIADQTSASLQGKLKDQPYSLALDESTDNRDTAQLAIFLRYFNSETQSYIENLLKLEPLHGRTTSAEIFSALKRVLYENNLSIANIVSVSTDGAPAMAGTRSGLVALLKKENPDIVAFHCIIHESVLCTKLSEEFSDLMSDIMKLINFLKSKSSLRHRQLQQFLQDQDAEYHDLLTHNNIRWLSRGNCLLRVWQLKAELIAFLSTISSPDAGYFLTVLADKEEQIGFLVDFFQHFNELNKTLQGKVLSELWKSLKAFQLKLPPFKEDLRSGEFTQFPMLGKLDEINHVDSFIEFIDKVQNEMSSRFKQLKDIDDVIALCSDPYHVSGGQWCDQLSKISKEKSVDIKLELCEIRAESASLADKFSNLDFWLKPGTQELFPHITNLIRRVNLVFGSTYLCESAFSVMQFIKNKYRSVLTDIYLDNLMKVSLMDKLDLDKITMTNPQKSHYTR